MCTVAPPNYMKTSIHRTNHDIQPLDNVNSLLQLHTQSDTIICIVKCLHGWTIGLETEPLLPIVSHTTAPLPPKSSSSPTTASQTILSPNPVSCIVSSPQATAHHVASKPILSLSQFPIFTFLLSRLCQTRLID